MRIMRFTKPNPLGYFFMLDTHFQHQNTGHVIKIDTWYLSILIM